MRIKMSSPVKHPVHFAEHLTKPQKRVRTLEPTRSIAWKVDASTRFFPNETWIGRHHWKIKRPFVGTGFGGKCTNIGVKTARTTNLVCACGGFFFNFNRKKKRENIKCENQEHDQKKNKNKKKKKKVNVLRIKTETRNKLKNEENQHI